MLAGRAGRSRRASRRAARRRASLHRCASPRLSQPQQIVLMFWAIFDSYFQRCCAGLGVEREDVVVARGDVHDPVVNDRRRLLRVLRRVAGAEVRPPDALQLTDVRGVDVVQRRVPRVLDVPPVRDPVALGVRTELFMGELGRRRDRGDGRARSAVGTSIGGGAGHEQSPSASARAQGVRRRCNVNLLRKNPGRPGTWPSLWSVAAGSSQAFWQYVLDATPARPRRPPGAKLDSGI